MDFNLRGAVIQNITGHNQEQNFEHTILDAIQSGEEKMPPGLGVLFEVLWQEASENEKNEILETLEQGLKPHQRQ